MNLFDEFQERLFEFNHSKYNEKLMRKIFNYLVLILRQYKFIIIETEIAYSFFDVIFIKNNIKYAFTLTNEKITLYKYDHYLSRFEWSHINLLSEQFKYLNIDLNKLDFLILEKLLFEIS